MTSSFGVTLVLIALFAAATLALLPVAQRAGPEIPGINSIFAAVIFTTELSTSFLLFVRFREQPAWSMLLLGCAYLYSALMAVPYALMFPGAVLAGTSLIGGSLSTAWVFIPWIFGFSLLALIAVMLEAGGARAGGGRNAEQAMFAGIALVAAAVIAISIVAAMFADRLPAFVEGARFTLLGESVSYTGVVMLAIGVAIIFLRIGRSNPLFLWLGLALAVMACANILSNAGGSRYSVGWTVCRLSWMVSACALFLYFMGQFVRQQRLLGHARDVLEQHVAERTADLTQTVTQRDLLLREVHHRVKNNFQVVNSLISFLGAHAAHDETKAALQNLHRRVYSLGLVHRQLMQSSNLATFDVRTFLDELSASLTTWPDSSEGRIRVVAEADPLMADPDFAGPLGLLITELVTHAVKRGFPGEKLGTVSISLRLRPSGEAVLTVGDNAAADSEPTKANAESRIMLALVKQLSGEIESAYDNGTIVTVMMPHPKLRVGID